MLKLNKEEVHFLVTAEMKKEVADFLEAVDAKIAPVLEYIKENPLPIPYTLVSCGEEGAIAQFGGQLYDVTAPSIDLVNPTGSGDATVAGAI